MARAFQEVMESMGLTHEDEWGTLLHEPRSVTEQLRLATFSFTEEETEA